MIRRAKSREAGEVPPRRGKRGKNWKPKEFMEGEEEAQLLEINNVNHAISSQNEKSLVVKNSDNSYQHQDDPNKLVLNNLHYETLFVDTTTDLKSIFESNFQEIPGNEKQSLGEFIICSFTILLRISPSFLAKSYFRYILDSK